MGHTTTVQRIYEAFGRGDVPAILACLAEDVEWEYGPVSTTVPWLQPRKGRDEVAGFFAALQALKFHKFAPTKIIGEGSLVVALADFDATVRSTGKRILEVDEVHLWHFNEAGLVQRFRHRADTHQHQLATQ